MFSGFTHYDRSFINKMDKSFYTEICIERILQDVATNEAILHIMINLQQQTHSVQQIRPDI
jgi:hypothetical protein